MSVNPNFIEFMNKLARVESVTKTKFHDKLVEILGLEKSDNLSDKLYQIKSEKIREGIPEWIAEGREVTITRYRYQGKHKDKEFIFVIETFNSEKTRKFSFHTFDWKGDFIKDNNIHFGKSDKNKAKTNLPFSNLDWLPKLLSNS